MQDVIEMNSLLCLTAASNQLILQKCDLKVHQLFRMSSENVNPELKQLFPPLTLEDLKFERNQMEEVGEITPMQDVSEMLHWGRIRRNKHENKCLTFDKEANRIELKFCKELENKKIDPDQMFEYSIDFTIRKFNSDFCLLHRNGNVNIEKCNNSTRFGQNLHTKQLVDIATLRCLELSNNILTTGICGKEEAIRKKNG